MSKQFEISDVLTSVTEQVEAVYDEVGDSHFQELSMALLGSLRELCAQDPQKAALRFGLSSQMVRLIADVPASRFYSALPALAEKLVFSLAPSTEVLKAALTSDNSLRSGFHIAASAYSNEYRIGVRASRSARD